jgi:hypothetical protein
MVDKARDFMASPDPTMNRPAHKLRHALAAIALAGLLAASSAARAQSSDFKITVLPGGTEMEYSGRIAFGASGALRGALNDNSAIKVLHLVSNGGSVYYARQMQYLVHDRGLTTVVDAHCLSACALVFLGGVERYMTPGAKLGFHRESADGESQAEINMVEESDAQFMRAMGISDAFVEKAFSTPSSDIWIPSVEELKNAHVINDVSTRFATPEDVKLPANLAEQVLGANPFKILQGEDPGRFKTIADAMRTAIAKSPAIADVTPLPSREVAPLVWSYWALADDPLALEFARSFHSYLVKIYASNPEECYLVFYSGRASSAFVPSAVLSGKDFADFADVEARLIADGVMRKAAPPSESEINEARTAMWRVFKERYPNLVSTLDNIDSADIDHGQACAALTGLLDAVLSLPEWQSGPLLRYVFRPS